jgi:ubiquinone/menaquinone biosynthesis C-methylase UbiE
VVAAEQGTVGMTGVDSRATSQERFGKLAQRYVTSESHAKGSELDRLVEMARPQPDWVALDIATGGGHTALKFAFFVAEVVATDITPTMLTEAEGFIGSQGVENVVFGLADAQELPFEDASFDLVTCRIAPHHFGDCPRFVRESARVLREGRLLLVQDHVVPEEERAARYVDQFERLRDPSHNRAYSQSEWIGMFQAAGLEVEHIEQIVKRHAFVPWAARQDCTPEVMASLVQMIERASPEVSEWMRPRDSGTAAASFASRHLLIAGCKVEHQREVGRGGHSE